MNGILYFILLCFALLYPLYFTHCALERQTLSQPAQKAGLSRRCAIVLLYLLDPLGPEMPVKCAVNRVNRSNVLLTPVSKLAIPVKQLSIKRLCSHNSRRSQRIVGLCRILRIQGLSGCPSAGSRVCDFSPPLRRSTSRAWPPRCLAQTSKAALWWRKSTVKETEGGSGLKIWAMGNSAAGSSIS